MLADHGCPWGWVRVLDNTDVLTPRILAEYKLKENSKEHCEEQSDQRNENFTSLSAHNPTVVGPDRALVTWHGKGLQATDLRNPARPVSADSGCPTTRSRRCARRTPPSAAATSIDLRNGLYILRYDGTLPGPVKDAAFPEGNSNVGQILVQPTGRRKR